MFDCKTKTNTISGVPVFDERPSDTQVLQGQSAMIDCHTSGIPRPTITWLKAGDPLPRDQRYLVMSSGMFHYLF